MKPLRSKVTFALEIVLGLALEIVVSSGVHAADQTPTPTTDSPLVENRTATELPDRRKIPTSREIVLRPEESDRQIRDRLQKIARSQDAFHGIQVKVTEGIVALSGKVEEAAVAKSFSALSERMEGVIGVVDQIKINDPKKNGLRLAESEATTLVERFFRSIPYLLSALVILVLTLGLGFAFLRLWRAILARRMAESPMLAETTARLLTTPIFVFGFYLIFRVGGLGGLASTVLGGTGVLGIVIGLAGQNILGNYLAGFMLTLRNPFKVGDQVTIGSESGSVYSVNSRCTMLLDGDGILVQIPNSAVLTSTIRNRTAHPMNQITLNIPVEPDTDSGDFRDAFCEALRKSTAAVAEDPAGQAFISGVSDGVVMMECTFWVDSIAHSVGKVRSNVLEALLIGLEDRGIRLARSAKFLRAIPRPESESTIEKKRRGLEASVETESSVPSPSKVLEARAKEVQDPEAPGLRSNLRKISAERSREAPPRSPTTSL